MILLSRPFIVCLLIISCVSISCSKKAKKESREKLEEKTDMVVFSDDVMAIIQNKCIGCHKPDSKNHKAKEELIWEELPTMQVVFLRKKLNDLKYVLAEGEMPPQKMLDKYPDKKLTEQETEILSNWVKTSLASLD